jgi:hypothetical protein
MSVSMRMLTSLRCASCPACAAHAGARVGAREGSAGGSAPARFRTAASDEHSRATPAAPPACAHSRAVLAGPPLPAAWHAYGSVHERRRCLADPWSRCRGCRARSRGTLRHAAQVMPPRQPRQRAIAPTGARRPWHPSRACPSTPRAHPGNRRAQEPPVVDPVQAQPVQQRGHRLRCGIGLGLGPPLSPRPRFQA